MVKVRAYFMLFKCIKFLLHFLQLMVIQNLICQNVTELEYLVCCEKLAFRLDMG